MTKPQPESASPVAAAPPPSSFLSRLSATVQHGLALSGSSIHRPNSLSDAISGFRDNFSFYWFNLICLIALIIVPECLSPNPQSLQLSLCLLSFCVSFCLCRPPGCQVVIVGCRFTDSQVLGILVAWVVILRLLPGWLLLPALLVYSAIFFIDSAPSVLKCFRMLKNMFLDLKESLNAGERRKMLGGATCSAAAAA